jgi:hypothetical protein
MKVPQAGGTPVPASSVATRTQSGTDPGSARRWHCTAPTPAVPMHCASIARRGVHARQKGRGDSNAFSGPSAASAQRHADGTALTGQIGNDRGR